MEEPIKLLIDHDAATCLLRLLKTGALLPAEHRELIGLTEVLEKKLSKPLTTKKYVVLGKQTHFTYDPSNYQVFCTHGGWGGQLQVNMNGSCEVGRVKYKTYVFTEADSYAAAKAKGLIER